MVRLHAPSARINPLALEIALMDFPTAWEIAGAAPLDDHDTRCSYVQTSGGLLCDCHVLTRHPQYIADYGEPTP
jgi:hypothetical protein